VAWYCSGDDSSTRAVLVLDGLMLVTGITLPRKRLVRSDVTVGLASTPPAWLRCQRGGNF
jgi:hypothetical protein